MLKQKFTRLSHLDVDQQATVQSIIEWTENSWRVTWVWNRELIGRAKDELEELSVLLNAYTKLGINRDISYWYLASNGVFSTKKLSWLIDEKTLQDNRWRQPTLRNNLVPSKVEIFIWRVLKRRLPVRTELDKRGINMDSVRCPICDDDVETIKHTMIFCAHSMDVWSRVFKC
ncbi:uncharacterized protein [Rutidosis leptorrhynchoides]|uniref:uncharacterized protein n=1 Tax=Rutidosis leptorrhynchoides TaxID=125765 RepID=UPI003A9A4204